LWQQNSLYFVSISRLGFKVNAFNGVHYINVDTFFLKKINKL